MVFPLIPLASSASACFRLLSLDAQAASGRNTMTQQKQTTIWERMLSTRHYRATNPIQYPYADGWTPLSALEMQYAAGY
jgi:hypothetical protein